MVCIDYFIRINEPSPDGIVVPRLKVIETGVGIVVVSAIAEGIVLRVGVRTRAVVYRFGAVAPCVVDVGDQFRSGGVVYCRNISLNVFLKEERRSRNPLRTRLSSDGKRIL